jgi:hypothetical protein
VRKHEQRDSFRAAMKTKTQVATMLLVLSSIMRKPVNPNI